MSRERLSRRRAEGGSGGSWLNTYADMVTLLLCFFVLLFAFSNVDEQRFQAVMSALRGSLGVLDSGPIINVIDTDLNNISELARQQLIELHHDLSVLLQSEGMDRSVSLAVDERGLTIRFADQVLFDLGKADLKPEAIQIIKKLSPMLKELPNPIRIEGHTDNLPINTPIFPSNWELSTHRATSVIRYLVEEEGFDPTKLSAAGYGEYRPIVPNDTAANRGLNRRVDIIIMSIDLWAEEPN